MENTSNDGQITLLQGLERDLAMVLADLKKIKDKLGIDVPGPPGGGTGGGGTGGGGGVDPQNPPM